jgi:hypothetical protein
MTEKAEGTRAGNSNIKEGGTGEAVKRGQENKGEIGV